MTSRSKRKGKRRPKKKRRNKTLEAIQDLFLALKARDLARLEQENADLRERNRL